MSTLVAPYNATVSPIRFPCKPPTFSFEPKVHSKSGSVLDKLAVLGMPYQRIVWLDADLFVDRNIDELCSLPSSVQFASTPYAPDGAPRCYAPGATSKAPQTNRFRSKQSNARLVREQELRDGLTLCRSCRPAPSCGAALLPHGDPSSTRACQYEFITGVFVVNPLPPAEYERRIVAPVCAGLVASRDGGDQGALASLLYQHGAFADLAGSTHTRVARLPIYYQASVRVRETQPELWVEWKPAVWHYGGWYKPWMVPRARTWSRRRAMFNSTLGKAWRERCPL